MLQGILFVISVFLQQERGYSAIQTGLTLVPATVGILLSSGMSQRMAGRHPQRLLIRAGFTVTLVGIVLLLLFVRADSANWTFLARAVPHGLRRRNHADGVGERGAVRVARGRPGRHLRRVPQRLEPGVVPGRRGCRFGPDRRGSSRNAPFLTAIIVVGAFAVVG